MDFKNGANMGYAFINFVEHRFAVEFIRVFKGLRLPALRSTKVCDVSWARIQSLGDNVDHYRNNPINSITDPIYRPLLFHNGMMVDFPRPDRPRVGKRVADYGSKTMADPLRLFDSNVSLADKIFIGGISAETDAHELRVYFSQFGTVLDCAIVKDRKTNCSRGFAFCSFAEGEAVGRVLAVRQHIIRGQSVGVRRYSVKR